jgi:hypothetical protein
LELWPFFALAFSFWGAVIIGYNHWAQVDGRTLVVLRTLGVWPLALLSLLFLPWPQDMTFYMVAAGMGTGLAYADTLLFNAAATHGGRLTALYIPLKMMIGFFLWIVIDPASATPLLAHPWKLAAVVAGFGACGTALMFLRKADASWTALAAVLPVALLLALGDVVAKEALGAVTAEHGWAEVIGRTVAFLTVTTTVGSVGGMVLGGKIHFTWADALRSAGFGVVLLTGLSLLLLTLAIAPNPGYVAAITMLSALWLAMWAHFAHGEHNNIWAGVALVAGAMLVALGG